jgi:hypothetical protein
MDPTYAQFRRAFESDDFTPIFQAFLTAKRLACRLPFLAGDIDAEWRLSGYDGVDVL